MVTNTSQDVSVSMDRYVAQLENRVQEQAQLIKLLNEKILNLESRAGESPKFSDVVKENHLNDGRASGRGASDDRRSKSSFLVIGSKKSDISSVPIRRYFQLFVTRIDPNTSPKKLAESLMSSIPELPSVVCSKLKTKHESYASFHVVVPEAEKELVCGDGVWPEGALVKQFFGKLLTTHVLDAFDSAHPDEVFSSSATKVNAGSTTDKKKNSSNVAAGSNLRPQLPGAAGSRVNAKSPAVGATSPKNTRLRAGLKNP